MLTNVVGIILTETSEMDLGALTKSKPFATVQIGGRFRMVDFILSNLTNAGVDDIGYFAEEPSQSLMRHLQDRRVWNLNSKNGGLNVLFQNTKEVGYTNSEIAHLQYVLTELDVIKDKEYVIVCNNMNYIFNYDFKELILKAIKKEVDIVGLYKKMPSQQVGNAATPIFHGKDGFVHQSAMNTGALEEINVDLGVYAMRVGLFKKIVQDAVGFKTTQTFQGALVQKFSELSMYANEFTGYVGLINTTKDYFDVSLDMLKPEVSKELFYGPNRVLTRSRDEASTFYGSEADVSNSMISSGCSIEGKVANSIISRRSHIEKDAVVENCIILNNTVIKRGTKIKNMIISKEVTISRNTELSGTIKSPYVIPEKTKI
ncbi:MAG: glucose-1-phosphate adenylyltransferase subunit GlgD [Culicoidibacterales bacterium]